MKLVGLAFARSHAGIRLHETKRVDLAVDRFSLRNSADIAAIEIGDPGRGRLRRVLEQTLSEPGSGGTFTEAQVDDAINRCRRLGLACHHRDDIRKPRPVVAWRQPVIQRRRVLDPLMSRAELLHQLDQHPDARWTGYIRADVNLTELIGGLARVREKTEAQIQGAAHFRNVAERATIGAARAIDYSLPTVDSSGPVESREIMATEEARRQLMSAVTRLGGAGSRLHVVAEQVIVHGLSVAQAAESIAGKSGGAARRRITSDVLQAATILAEAFGFAADRTSRAKATGWQDGSQQTFTREGKTRVISTRRWQQ